ncbi:MAG TPA: DNA polymerase I [Clostridia bacterium]|nr:DNA polymerase I [Clostridia bacterium]
MTEITDREAKPRKPRPSTKGLFLLVDGNSLVNRAFFALPPFTTSKGQPTNAVYGFANMLFRLLDERNPSHMAVAFDKSAPTFRHVEYEGYKAHRTGMPDPLRSQIPLVKEVLEALRVPIFELEGYEADDLIATLAKRAEADGFEVIIVTGDRDAVQLVSPRIRTLITKKGISEMEEYDEGKVFERYGIPPERIPDLKGLMGDSSDNIPGVPGIGEKTAVRLIREFGNLEALLERKAELTEKRLREALEAYEEQAVLSKRLATVDTSIPIDVDWEECRRGDPDRDALLQLFKELEFRSLMGKVAGLSKGAPGPGTSEAGELFRGDEEGEGGEYVRLGETIMERPEAALVVEAWDRAAVVEASRNIRAVLDKAAAEGASERDGTDLIALFHMEGGGITASPSGVFLGVRDGSHWLRSYYVHGPALDARCRENFLEFLAGSLGLKVGPKDWERSGACVTTSKWHPVTGYALKPALVFLLHEGVPVDPLSFAAFDAEIAGYLLDPTRSGYRLEDLAREHLDVEIPDLETLALKPAGERESDVDGGPAPSARKSARRYRPGNVVFETLPPGKQAWLMEKRADAVAALRKVMTDRIADSGMDFLFYEVELPLMGVLADMENTGVRVEPTVLDEMGKEIGSRLAEVAAAIYRMAGLEFNINSTKQLSEVLFERLKLPVVKRTKTGYSTDAEVLEVLAAHHDIAVSLLEHRQLMKLKGTYIDGLRDVMHRKTNKIHSTFNQTITATGRISSTEPNLQNIPIRLELGRRIRRVFIPSTPENRLLAGDYSQIELRVLAHVSGDPVLTEAFKAGEDIHRRTASEVFGVPPEEVTPEMRSRAKAVNFGIVYGMSDFGLSRDIGVSKSEAARYIENYFNRYKGVKDYVDLALVKARATGYATTILNRRRPIPDIHSRNVALRKLAERTAINTPIQGSAADIIKLAMVRIFKRLREGGFGSKMILQVHDELIFDVPIAEMDAVKELVRKEMEGVFDLNVPLKVDLKSGASWYDMEEER